jgi:Zn-dependent M28 family amino/carboxypeptidase
VADLHNHPEPENFEALAKAAWPATPPRIDRYLLADWVDRITIPVATVSTPAARSILRKSGHSLDDQARAAEKGGGASFVSARAILSLSTDVRRHVVPDRNVLAAIEGRDPELKNEWVIVSCHHDHDGADGDRIFNGADDNGSGTVAVIEIAEAYALAAQDGKRPKRSVLFAAFNSEERGLLGSWAFVERPPVPLEKVVAMLNMDMVGRDEEVPEGGGSRFRGLPVQSSESNRNSVNILGYSRSASLSEVVERANTTLGLTLKKVLDNNASNLLRRSDQWPFLNSGVPALFFHTGLHPDYHTTGDRPETVHYAKMERIVRLVHQASWDLAELAERPRLDRDHGRRELETP